MKQSLNYRVLKIINDCIDQDNSEKGPITEEQVDDNLGELGVDSISFIKIIVMLEDEFECVITDSKLLFTEMDTVQKIIEVLNLSAKDSLLHTHTHHTTLLTF